MVKHKTLARSLIILSVIALFMEGCYFFCLFKPDDMFEDVVEQFMEEGISSDEAQHEAAEEEAQSGEG